jgi:conjugative transfer region protein TrbK
MKICAPARVAAFVALGIAFGMAALALREPAARTAATASRPAAVTGDPLQRRLIGCRMAGEAAAKDQGCLRAWEANRRRFLGHREPSVPEPVPDEQPGKSTDPIPLAPDDTDVTSQEQ